MISETLRADEKFFVSSADVLTHIIIPTIAFCIGMVIAMLIGINKCKQWELDKVCEIRRTRRVLQRITARLRERNFKAIQRARDIRKRNIAAKTHRSLSVDKSTRQSTIPPPLYGRSAITLTTSGNSPPPSYEESLLDQLYQECISFDGKNN